MSFRPALLALLVLAACELPPRFVREPAEIDNYVNKKLWASACVGLKMANDDDLRRYTSTRLAAVEHVRAARACLCDALYDAEGHTVDLAVATGLKGTRRDDLADCLKPAVDDARIQGEDRVALVQALAHIDARNAYALLEGLATDDPDPAVRAAASRGLLSGGTSTPVLVKVMQADGEAAVRQAAAEALVERSDRDAVDDLVHAATGDDDGGVRAAALLGVAKSKHAKRDEITCTAMLEDPDERVRDQAVRAYHGSKRVAALTCLEKRLLTEEESTLVRSSVLKALGASPSQKAADILCDGIGPFLRLYVKDEIAEQMSAVNIIEVHNGRDWERSLECANRALGQGGYSCYARNHLGHNIREFGGSAATPWCPGMERN